MLSIWRGKMKNPFSRFRVRVEVKHRKPERFATQTSLQIRNGSLDFAGRTSLIQKIAAKIRPQKIPGYSKITYNRQRHFCSEDSPLDFEQRAPNCTLVSSAIFAHSRFCSRDSCWGFPRFFKIAKRFFKSVLRSSKILPRRNAIVFSHTKHYGYWV